jgi:hypothetical protein
VGIWLPSKQFYEHNGFARPPYRTHDLRTSRSSTICAQRAPLFRRFHRTEEDRCRYSPSFVTFCVADTLFSTTLNAGDVFLFPRGLIHFQQNTNATGSAKAIAALNSQNPGTQVSGRPDLISGFIQTSRFRYYSYEEMFLNESVRLLQEEIVPRLFTQGHERSS